MQDDTLSTPSQIAPWNVDPQNLLSDPRVNPEMRSAALVALQEAVSSGLRPQIHEAYRPPGRSDDLAAQYQQGSGHRATAGWRSPHNYGLALDIYLYDKDGNPVEAPRTINYQPLATTLKSQGFVWGEPINDAVHFEYHPSHQGLLGGSLLTQLKDWAFGVTGAAENEPTQRDETGVSDPDKWLHYIWSALGAGSELPMSSQVMQQEGQQYIQAQQRQEQALQAQQQQVQELQAQQQQEQQDQALQAQQQMPEEPPMSIPEEPPMSMPDE